MPNTAFDPEGIAAAITIGLMLYSHASDVAYTKTARSTEAEQRLCSEALTSEVALLQSFCTYEMCIPLSTNF